MKNIDYKTRKEYALRKGMIEIYNTQFNGWLTDYRIPDDEVPKGYVKYEIRHSDYDDMIFATLEKRVVVNFAATFLTDKKNLLKTKKYEEIEDWDWSADWGDDEKHTIIDTAFGEVMVKEGDTSTELYIGDNFDEFVGELETPYDEVTADDIERILS